MCIIAAVSDGDGQEHPRVEQHRIDRVIEVLGYLTLDEFDVRALTIAPREDSFGVLEQVVMMVAHEYIDAIGENRRMDDERTQMIDKLRGAVKALSTPIIDVWDGILSLPIAGVVDAERATEMTERLLTRISHSGARCVIIDITGVDEVDAATAAHLLRMVRATRLLGAYTLVSGIQPSVAQAFVDLDQLVHGSLTTVRSLRDGLQICMAYLNRDTKVRRG